MPIRLIEELPPVCRAPSDTHILAAISSWGEKLVAPLGASAMSANGMMELAGRVYWIVGLVIAAVIVARKYGYLTGRVTPHDSSSPKLTEVNADFSDLLRDVRELRQFLQQRKRLTEQPRCRQEGRQIGEICGQIGLIESRIKQCKAIGINAGFTVAVRELVQLWQQRDQLIHQMCEQGKTKEEELSHQLSQLGQQEDQVWQRIDQHLSCATLTESGSIGEDAKRVQVAFETVLSNLNEIRGNAGKEFNERVHQFYQTHANKKDNQAYAKAFELVKFDENNFKDLAEMQGAIFFSNSYMDDQNIMHNPLDGNCLFHGLGKGLTFLEPELKKAGKWNDKFPFDHAGMRKAIHQWMLENLDKDEQLRAHIDSAIIEYCPILERELQGNESTIQILADDKENDVIEFVRSSSKKEEQIRILKTVAVDIPGGRDAHLAYLEMTCDEGKFASSPQIYAFCQLNPAVGVRISRRIKIAGKDGAEPRIIISKEFDLPFNSEATTYVINPVYNVAGNHFDLLIEK